MEGMRVMRKAGVFCNKINDKAFLCSQQRAYLYSQMAIKIDEAMKGGGQRTRLQMSI